MSPAAEPSPEPGRAGTPAFDAERRPGYLMRRGVKRLSQVWSATEVGLTIPQFAILVELDRNDGLDQRTLSERVLIDQSTTADMCRRLVRRGDIERERDDVDQRRFVVRITAQGRSVLAAAVPLAREVDEVLLARLDPAEQQQFLLLLRKSLGLD